MREYNVVSQLCLLVIIALACLLFSSILRPKLFNANPLVMDKMEAKCFFIDIINNNRFFVSAVVFSYQNSYFIRIIPVAKSYIRSREESGIVFCKSFPSFSTFTLH